MKKFTGKKSTRTQIVVSVKGNRRGRREKRDDRKEINEKEKRCECIVSVSAATRYHVSLRNYYYMQLPSRERCRIYRASAFNALLNIETRRFHLVIAINIATNTTLRFSRCSLFSSL